METRWIQHLLGQHPEKFGRFLDQPDRYKLQVLITELIPNVSGAMEIDSTSHRLGAEYIYPASTIKLCSAIGALERLAEMRDRGAAISRQTPMVIHPLFADSVIEDHDDSNLGGNLAGGAPPGSITIDHCVRKIGLVSDNPAHNFLYEFLGHRGINERMWAYGLTSIRIRHRLSQHRTPIENMMTAQVDFQTSKGVLTVPTRTSTLEIPPESAATPGLNIGHAQMINGRVVDGAMSFATKNHAGLSDLQKLLLLIVRPEIMFADVPRRPRLDDSDRSALLQSLRQYPADSLSPRYAREQYPDAYGKFLLPGLVRVRPKQEWVMHNKCGQAFGFTLDNAHIRHGPTGRECAVAASIYTNDSGVMNIDGYDYQRDAFPFFADLGETIGRWMLGPRGKG